MEAEKKKILLVGANGLTGGAFQRLFSTKYDIVALTRETVDSFANTYIDTLDAVVYLAQSPEYKTNQFTTDLFKVNVELLHRILTSTADASRRFIYFSTGSVYDFSGIEEVNESSPVNHLSGNPYVASKLMGEELVQSFRGKFAGLSIVRPFFIYGNRQKDSMLFSVMKKRLLNGETIELSSGKGLIFNPVYADDAAMAISQLIEKDGDALICELNNSSSLKIEKR